MEQEVILTNVIAIQSLTEFGINFVPLASDLRTQPAMDRVEIFVEALTTVLERVPSTGTKLHAFANRKNVFLIVSHVEFLLCFAPKTTRSGLSLVMTDTGPFNGDLMHVFAQIRASWFRWCWTKDVSGKWL